MLVARRAERLAALQQAIQQVHWLCEERWLLQACATGRTAPLAACPLPCAAL